MLDQRNCSYTFFLRRIRFLHLKTIAVLPVMVFFMSCTNDMKEVEKFRYEEDLPSEIVENVDLIYSDSAIVQLRLKAPEIHRYTGSPEYTEFPKGIKTWFYDPYGNPNASLKAGYAMKFEDDGITELREDVEVINPKGEVLETEFLLWDEEDELIYTDAFVQIRTETEVLYGKGLEADQNLDNYIIKNITGRIDIDDEDEETDTIF